MKAKQKTMLRVFGLLLALLMVVASFAACSTTGTGDDTGTPSGTSGGGTSGEGETEPATNEWGEEDIKNGVPEDLDYNDTLQIAMRPADSWTREIDPSNLGDQVNQQICYRNIAVSNQLGVEIKVSKLNELTTGHSNYNQWIIAQHMADAGTVDLVISVAAQQVRSGLKDCFVDLQDSTKLTYLDLNKNYWNQNYMDSAELYGKLYYLVGDMNLSVYDRTLVTFANYKTLAALEYGDIFETVMDGDWTLEKMQEIMAEYPYVDNDSVEGKSAGDQFAIVGCYSSEVWDAWLGGFGLNLSQKTEDGGFEFCIEGNTALESAGEKVYQLMQSANAFTYAKIDSAFDWFINGTALFDVTCLSPSPAKTSALRAFEDQYAILPMPKYDSNQTSYSVCPQDTYNVMSVMDGSSVNTEMVSAWLELTCSKSYDKVRPMYVTQMLTGKYLAMAENVEVMNLILDSVHFDPAVIFSLALNDFEQTLWRNNVRKGNSILNAWDARKTKDQNALDDLLLWYMTGSTD